MTVSRALITGSGVIEYNAIIGLSIEIGISLVIGAVIGKGIAIYIKRVGHDLLLFLLFLAFGITKISLAIGLFMADHFGVELHLEPLLICMCAGFFVQNFSRTGEYFMESLERAALPIFVIFFTLAGASLNLQSVLLCWPLALCIVVVRAAGIFGSAWLAGTINKDPAIHNNTAWMAYLTQAGVAIGLAQLANRQFPEIGVYLTTVVLAVITINQIIGPITFKAALNIVKEAKR